MIQTNHDLAAFVPARELKHGTQKTLVQWHDGQALIAGFGLNHQRESNSVARVIGEDPLR